MLWKRLWDTMEQISIFLIICIDRINDAKDSCRIVKVEAKGVNSSRSDSHEVAYLPLTPTLLDC